MSPAKLRPPSPHAKLYQLMTSLGRAGWGDLAGREWQGVRSTLAGLVTQLPYASGAGTVTVPQVADAAGLSIRWVRRCLHVLEDLGVITWTRGGVVSGRAAPSHIRIIKSALVRLIEAARPALDEKVAARAAKTRERIAALRRLYIGPQQRKRRSAPAALDAGPRPSRGGTPGFPSPPQARSDPPSTCPHGEPRGPAGCALCRHGIAA